MPVSQSDLNNEAVESNQEQGRPQPLSSADQEIEQERQTHLRTIELLDRVANGEKAAGRLLPDDLLEDPLDAHLL
jgi:hypothetical protein